MSLSDKLQELVIAKEDMKTALIGKGVTPTGGLSTYADAINRIESGGSELWAPPNGICFWNSVCNFIPKFDTRNIYTMEYMFRESTIDYAPDLETKHITNMQGCFIYCYDLKTIPQYDTSSFTKLSSFLFDCNSLVSVPLLECGNCRTINSILTGSYNVTDIGGFKDLGKVMFTKCEHGVYWNVTTEDAFHSCKKITRESCLNIFNNLYDITNNPNGYTPELTFEREVIARLSEEDILIAVQKGWIISSY